MLELKLRKSAVFEPFRKPSRYKGAFGGRGSGKSYEFADNLWMYHAQNPGARSVCIRESQKSLKESAKALIEGQLTRHDAWHLGFEQRHDVTVTPGGGVIIYQGMRDHTAESIKSLENFSRAWIEEAQTLSSRSLELLRPTIRAPGSELWFSWNPRFPRDAVDQMLRGPLCPSDAIIVKANWNDNLFFPKELEQERLDCLNNEPEKYDHIWEGGYVQIVDGAYYSEGLALAEREGRIGNVSWDHLYDLRCYWDIGGTSRKSDATSIWVVQFAGDTIRVLDYYEAIGQEFQEHTYWLKQNGYERATQYLPHDGGKHDTVFRATPQSFLRDAGFNVITLPNAGSGAARLRIDAVRRTLPKCWFNRDTTEGGREALAWYHERRDEARNYGLGPEHDWSSHASDAFGEMARDFLNRVETGKKRAPLKRGLKGVA